MDSILSIDRFPIEITTQILTFLPAKYILRSRPVCKTWKNIIDNPQFRHMHFTNSTQPHHHHHHQNSKTFLFLPSDCHAIYILEQDSEHNFNSSRLVLRHPEAMLDNSYTKLSVNGYFCFYYDDPIQQLTSDCYTYVCNPFTQQFQKLPDFTDLEVQHCHLVAGFGFDKLRREFKVVQIVYTCSGGFRLAGAWVYALGSNSWRKLKNVPNVKFCRRNSLALNNSVHWLLFYNNESILKFDLESESFGFMELPEDRFSTKDGMLINMDGCLSVADVFSDAVELWVMKDYGVRKSWRKTIILRKYVKHDVFNGVRYKNMKILPVSFWMDGEILMLLDSRVLASYNVESGRFSRVYIHGDGPPQDCKFQRRNREIRDYSEVHHCLGNILSLQGSE